MLDRCDFTPLLTAVGGAAGYLNVLARRGFAQLTDAIKDEIVREVAFWGFLGAIAGAILDYI